jgi:nucleoside-diphosphate-sugar epimerase
MSVDSVRSSVFVTGGTGFLGSFVVDELLRSGFHVRCAVRGHSVDRRIAGADAVVLPDLRDLASRRNLDLWITAMSGARFVIHLAAVAHKQVTAGFSAELLEQVNSAASGALAACASEAGVERLLYVSTAGVHGNRSLAVPISENSALLPHDAYTRSKLEGEISVAKALRTSRTEWVVIRPPLVFGPNAPGNLRRLCTLIDTGLPLPLASIRNQRSMISVWNLADAIRHAMSHSTAKQAAWLVADEKPLSTPDLISAIAKARGRSSRLIRLPVPALNFLGSLFGRRQELARLCDDLLLDCSQARSKLGWVPPVPTVQGLLRAFSLPNA